MLCGYNGRPSSISLDPGCQTDDLWFDDPSPPRNSGSESDWKLYLEELEAYAAVVLEAFKELDFCGEKLWIEYTATFRPISILFLSTPTVRTWTKFLLGHGVLVRKRTVLSMRKFLLFALHTFVSTFDQHAEDKESCLIPSISLPCTAFGKRL
ncbi:hypothetical protein FGB62_189g019 [Gracilaria domingensis]|nr:hypothetical protein FGB62_189g019 [Gracilaria domingensis]